MFADFAAKKTFVLVQRLQAGEGTLRNGGQLLHCRCIVCAQSFPAGLIGGGVRFAIFRFEATKSAYRF